MALGRWVNEFRAIDLSHNRLAMACGVASLCVGNVGALCGGDGMKLWFKLLGFALWDLFRLPSQRWNVDLGIAIERTHREKPR